MISDTIKIIKCPRLSIHNHGDREVAVKFNEQKEGDYFPLEPHSIMCDRYNPGKGCACRDSETNAVKYEPCIFAEWKPLRRE